MIRTSSLANSRVCLFEQECLQSVLEDTTKEVGNGVGFFSLIRILILSLGGLLQNNYYTYLLSGRQLDKTESFFW